MEEKKRDFDAAAASWDEKPTRVKLANDVAAAIRGQVPLAEEMDVLEFGCGTGLLGLRFCPKVRSLTGVDSSAGMLEVFRRKAAALKHANAQALQFDLDSGAALPGRYDLAVSSMTLHHVKETESLLRRLFEALRPGGQICIADLDSEGGLFHENNEGIFHCGFDREKLGEAFMAAGFTAVRALTAAELKKTLASGEERAFTIFLMTGRKPG